VVLAFGRIFDELKDQLVGRITTLKKIITELL
jgi:hypothetical protein